MEVRETRDSESLEALREEWESLLERCSSATIYQTWEWNQAWWQAFGKGKQLRLIQLRRDGRLAGIAPLYVSSHLRTPLRRLAFVGTGPTDYLDVIADNSESDSVCAALLDHIGKARGYDLADLQQLSPNSILLNYVNGQGWLHQSSDPQNTKGGFFAPLGVTTETGLHEGSRRLSKYGGEGGYRIISQEPCPHLPLPSSWEELTARLGKKTRSNLSYYDRLIERSFERVEIGLAEGQSLESSMSALFDLHQKRWRARWLPGVLGGERTQQFHLTTARRFLERGWLRLHLMRLDGNPVAAIYCFQFRGRCSYYLGGFAPDLAKYSPGTVLTARAIRTAIEEGCEDFDFLRGNEPYKYRWQPEERHNVRLLIADPGRARGRAMLVLNRLERRIEHHAKAFAEKQGRRKRK